MEEGPGDARPLQGVIPRERRTGSPRALSPSEGMKGPMPVPVPTGACPSRGVAVPSAVSQSCGAMCSRLPPYSDPFPARHSPPPTPVSPRGAGAGWKSRSWRSHGAPRRAPRPSALLLRRRGRRGGAARGMRARGREWEWAPVGSAGSRLGSDRESTCWRREEPRVERGHAALPRVRGAQERVSVCVCVHLRACIGVGMSVGMEVHVCIHAWVCMRVCMGLCTATEQERCPESGGGGGGISRTGCRCRGQAGAQTDRHTDRHRVQGGSRPRCRARGDAGSTATFLHQSGTGAGWSHLLHGGVIRVTQGLHIWKQGDPRKPLGLSATPPDEPRQLGAAWAPTPGRDRMAAGLIDALPRRPRKWQIPSLRRLLVELEMAAPLYPGTLLES